MSRKKSAIKKILSGNVRDDFHQFILFLFSKIYLERSPVHYSILR